MPQIVVDGLQERFCTQCFEKLRANFDESGRAARCHIQPSEEPLPFTLDGAHERMARLRIGRIPPFPIGKVNLGGIRAEVFGEVAEKLPPVVFCQFTILVERLTRERCSIRLASL